MVSLLDSTEYGFYTNGLPTGLPARLDAATYLSGQLLQRLPFLYFLQHFLPAQSGVFRRDEVSSGRPIKPDTVSVSAKGIIRR